MAIEVKHGAHPASTLYARFGGAEGQAWRRALEGFLRARERQAAQRQAYEYRRDLAGMAHEQDLEKMDIAFQQRAMLGERQGMYDLERQRLRNLGRQQELETRLDYEKEMYDYQLTSEQKADEAKLRQALYLIEHDESFSPEDRLEARRRIIARMADIEPLPTRKEPSPYPPGRGVGDYWYDPQFGGWLYRGEKDIKELTGAGVSSSEALKMAINSATNTETNEIDWNAAQDTYRRILSFGAAPSAGGPAGLLQAPGEVAPLTGERADQQIKGMEDFLQGLMGYSEEVKKDIRKYGGVTKLKEPNKLGNIAETEAHILTLQRSLGKERRKHLRKVPEGASDEELGIGTKSIVNTKYETDLIKEIQRYEGALEELKKMRNKYLIYLHMAETNRALAGQ